MHRFCMVPLNVFQLLMKSQKKKKRAFGTDVVLFPRNDLRQNSVPLGLGREIIKLCMVLFPAILEKESGI